MQHFQPIGDKVHQESEGSLGKDEEEYRIIGTFLVITADKKEKLSNSEYRKAVLEVDDVAMGRYYIGLHSSTAIHGTSLQRAMIAQIVCN